MNDRLTVITGSGIKCTLLSELDDSSILVVEHQGNEIITCKDEFKRSSLYSQHRDKVSVHTASRRTIIVSVEDLIKEIGEAIGEEDLHESIWEHITAGENEIIETAVDIVNRALSNFPVYLKSKVVNIDE